MTAAKSLFFCSTKIWLAWIWVEWCHSPAFSRRIRTGSPTLLYGQIQGLLWEKCPDWPLIVKYCGTLLLAAGLNGLCIGL